MANVNFHNVSKEEELLKNAYSDMIAFGKLFLPQDYMRSETPWFHYEIADSINDMENLYQVIIFQKVHPNV